MALDLDLKNTPALFSLHLPLHRYWSDKRALLDDILESSPEVYPCWHSFKARIMAYQGCLRAIYSSYCKL